MPRQSAGILLYRINKDVPEVFLVHPGGPFWVKKDAGAWSIPKGEYEDNEEPLEAARREFKEETGIDLQGDFIPLDEIKQKGGKKIQSFALKGDLDESRAVSNTFSMEWPPRSGRMQEFPEVDRFGWFDLITARTKINEAQTQLLDELEFFL